MTDLNLVASLLDAGLTGHPVVVSGDPAAATLAVVSAPTQVRRTDCVVALTFRWKKKKKKSRSRSPPRRRRSRSSSRSRRHGRSSRRSRSRERRRETSRSRSRSPRKRKQKRSRSPSPPKGDVFEKVAETAEEKVVRDRIRDQCTVLVSSLPVKATSRDIATYFSQCGTIRDVRLIKDRNQRVTKGFAYVEFETPEQASAALRLTGALFQNRSLVVQPTQNEKNRANEAKEAMKTGGAAVANAPTKVYVGSLHFNVTEEAVRSIFQPFGNLMEVQLHRDASGLSRGFGFVTFGSASEARRAIAELNGLEVLGRPIKVGESKGHEVPGRDDGKGDGDELEGDDVMVLNQATRSMLMAKLQRENDRPSSVIDAVQEAGMVLVPSRCLVLQNCFDAALEDARPDNANWEIDIEGDVKAECESHGTVEHCKLEKESGCIYVKFSDIGGAVAAREALNGRFFGGQTIAVNFVSSQVYAKKYGI